MKRKFISKSICAFLLSSVMLSAVPIKAHAEWINNYYGSWAYSQGYGLVRGWKYIDGFWYYFDGIGRMQTKWIADNGKWYYLNSSGQMQTGVIQIEGKIYLFGPSGDMQVGLCVVNGKEYNFADRGACIGEDMPTPEKAYDYYGENTTPFRPDQIMNSNSHISDEIPSDNGEKVIEYRVTYKDSDTGETLSVRRINSENKISLYEPSKSGYRFVEWNTKKDGSGTSYESGEKLKLTKDITLYAQWNEIEEKKEEEEQILVTDIKIKTATSSNTNAIPTVFVNEKLQFSRIITPSNATDTKVKWSIRSTREGGKATIDNNGLLTGIKPGIVTVIATAKDGSGAFKEQRVQIEE
ncbi:MAG: bacteriocin [Clostridium butyricum]|nr:bacteriocin [Clostridium butyricum]